MLANEVEGEAVDLVAVDDFLPAVADCEDDNAFPEPDGGFAIMVVECEGALVALPDDDDDCVTEPPFLPLVGVPPFAMLLALRRRLGNMAPGSVFFAGVMVGLTLRCCPSPVFDGPLPLTP